MIPGHGRVELATDCHGRAFPSLILCVRMKASWGVERMNKLRSSVQIQYADQIHIRKRNKLYYRFAHWPIWIFVFYLLPGQLTFALFSRGFDRRMTIWLAVVLVCTGIAGLRGRLPGVEPSPYIIRFTEDRPNPLYRRFCYTAAWGDLISYAALNMAGVADAIISGRWHMAQIYHDGYYLIVAVVWISGALGKLPRVKPSTLGEGEERRAFYGTIWAVTIGQVVLLVLWKGLSLTHSTDKVKLVAFAVTVIFLGFLAMRGRLPRTRRIVTRELNEGNQTVSEVSTD